MKYGFVQASLSRVMGATTDTARTPVAGYPVRGSMMWLYTFPSTMKNFS
jgi:hypothetical protein